MEKCVIFDMDGVIIDSEPIHQKCERMVFSLLGVRISDEEHNALVGATDKTMWEQLGKTHEFPIQTAEIIALKKSLYMECLKREVCLRPIPHVQGLIVSLAKNGFTLALASSSPRQQIDYILERFDMKDLFMTTVSGEEVENGKPDPDIFLKAASRAGVKPHVCTVIEDSFNGITAAKKAGMKSIGFINPNSGSQDLSGADLMIRSFQELSPARILALLPQEHPHQ
jgi:HAD superfamily hydrolase (TIGR01509 family)